MTMFAMKHHNCPTCRCTEPASRFENVYDAIMPESEQAKLISKQQQQITELQHELAICIDALYRVEALDLAYNKKAILAQIAREALDKVMV